MIIRLEYHPETKSIVWGTSEILWNDFEPEEIFRKSNSIRDNFVESDVNLVTNISVELPLFEDDQFWKDIRRDLIPTLSNTKVIKKLHINHSPKIMNKKTIQIFVRQIAKLFGCMKGLPICIMEVDIQSYIDLLKKNSLSQPIFDLREHEFVYYLESSSWNCEFKNKHDLIFTTTRTMTPEAAESAEIKPKPNRTVNISETLRKNRLLAQKMRQNQNG